MSDMTVLIQVRARHTDAGEALIQRLRDTLPPRMKSVVGSLPDGRARCESQRPETGPHLGPR